MPDSLLNNLPAKLLAAVFVLACVAAPSWAQERLTNSLGMKFARISAGEFQMGSPENEEGRSDDEPQHSVKISRPFYLGQHEVTLGQFRKFVTETGYKTEIERGLRPGFGYVAEKKFVDIQPDFNWRDNGLGQTDDHAVINIGWDDAVAFCRWLSAKENAAYRLPTEAEWEYACRGGAATAYSTGDSEASLREYANLADASFLSKYTDATWSVDWNDGQPFTAPVGSFKPNAVGLYDMHGNAWEWCSDWYGKVEKKSSPDIDPVGPTSGERRMLRGGSFTNRSRLLRSADRDCFRPKYRYNFTGFRVVRAAD